MNRTRLLDAGAIVIAAAITLGIAGVSHSVEVTPPYETSSSVRDEHAASAARPLALFIGDSYTAGEGTAEMSYACRAALRMGWLCALSAVGGTGYISGGPANRWDDPYTGKSLSYIERIPGLAAKYDPDLVVLDGGRNDDFAPRAYAFEETASTIGEVRRAWPRAQIVFVRPRFLADPRDDLGMTDQFMARLQATPEAKGVIFIDPLSALSGTDTSDLLASDEIHPNARGEQHILAALIEALQTHHVRTPS
ncbi:SGNH/GDSL hydrolase family protein [Mycolicibacterium smegmatis]|uniref:SGNH/GDSL hydrolase family protein n=1 Tax=Mycolicibacterium smegmatis TaxID=1772 RepID=UPI001EFA4F06|nr:SGNH/GDSL hydrolase family protein [Mycolicibacterium smegmatis]ULN34670.1 SGNH/GDSL hydrolase family protein [Mycolicibacterium smegmatis]